ncbi:unnamed protein product, partial [Urochloa humidicola]
GGGGGRGLGVGGGRIVRWHAARRRLRSRPHSPPPPLSLIKTGNRRWARPSLAPSSLVGQARGPQSVAASGRADARGSDPAQAGSRPWRSGRHVPTRDGGGAARRPDLRVAAVAGVQDTSQRLNSAWAASNTFSPTRTTTAAAAAAIHKPTKPPPLAPATVAFPAPTSADVVAAAPADADAVGAPAPAPPQPTTPPPPPPLPQLPSSATSPSVVKFS